MNYQNTLSLVSKKKIDKLRRAKVKINIGAGQEKIPGDWIRVDISEHYNPDVVHDLTKIPWPFDDNYADAFLSSHVIEHLPDHTSFIKEIVRIAKPDALFVLIFPHFSRCWFSSQHLRAYGINLLNDYDENIIVEHIRLKYMAWGWKHWYRFPVYTAITFVEFLANLSPWFWERVWCYWFGGFDHVILECRIKKSR
ncbi:MAG TPA: methyltransferase domain-containing protein [Candidatus Paceibacterota bacterium]